MNRKKNYAQTLLLIVRKKNFVRSRARTRNSNHPFTSNHKNTHTRTTGWVGWGVGGGISSAGLLGGIEITF